MRNHTGNLHKEAKALPSSKVPPPPPTRLRSDQYWNKEDAMTAFGKRSQTSPYNRFLQSNLALDLNPS